MEQTGTKKASPAAFFAAAFGVFALDQLTKAGDPWSDLAQRVEYGLAVAESIEKEAAFLAGLSLGQELARI